MATVTAEIARLTPKQRKYVKARANGLPAKTAALKAGYAKSTATKGISQIENEDVKTVFREIVRRACSPAKLAQRLADGLDAQKTEFFAKDGIVTDTKNTIAWGERRQYLELAAEYGGYISKDDHHQDHLHLHVNSLVATEQPPERPAIDVPNTQSD